MSMMEPDEAEWMPADDPAAESSWMPADAYDERVWGMPPRPPPGVRPPGGQLPGRPVWPFWGYWGYRLRNAQRDIKYLAEVVNDILDARLEQLGKTGIQGVTDGSSAAVGMVGEFFVYDSPSLTYTGDQVITHAAAILQPGDWDVYGMLEVDNFLNSASIGLDPIPPGFSSDMSGWFGAATPGTEYMSVIMPTAAARISVPTLLPFGMSIHAPGSGTVKYHIQARRRR